MREESNSVVLINENALDKECIRLPGDYLKYAHISAECKRDVDEAKAALSVAEADISKDIRDRPAQYGLEKVTEGAIRETLALQKGIKNAQAKLREAEHQANLAQAMVWALEHKKRSLTLLVELHGMGYFANPKVSERGKEAVEKMTQGKVRRRWQDEE